MPCDHGECIASSVSSHVIMGIVLRLLYHVMWSWGMYCLCCIMPFDHGECIAPSLSCHVVMGNVFPLLYHAMWSREMYCPCWIMPCDHGKYIAPAVSCHVIMRNVLCTLKLCIHMGQERLLSPRLHRMTSRVMTATCSPLKLASD